MCGRLRLLVAGSLLIVVFGFPVEQRAAAQTSVSNLDESRMVGVWYEMARLPNKQQKNCTSDAVELIARGDRPGSLSWVNACITNAHYNDANTSYVRPEHKRDKPGSVGEGRYRIYTVWPFSRKYWVLAIAPDNSWLLVGSPNRKSLWIYAKAQQMQAGVLAQIKAQAAGEGYDVGRMITQSQSGVAAATVIARK